MEKVSFRIHHPYDACFDTQHPLTSHREVVCPSAWQQMFLTLIFSRRVRGTQLSDETRLGRLGLRSNTTAAAAAAAAPLGKVNYEGTPAGSPDSLSCFRHRPGNIIDRQATQGGGRGGGRPLTSISTERAIAIVLHK